MAVTLRQVGPLSGLFWYWAPGLPAYALMIYTLGLGLPASFAVLLASMLPAATTWFLHPYAHLSRNDAKKAAGAIMRRILNTRYFDLTRRAHYIHHRRMDMCGDRRGDGGNYSLLHPVGDVLLGQYQRPALEQLLAMYEIGM